MSNGENPRSPSEFPSGYDWEPPVCKDCGRTYLTGCWSCLHRVGDVHRFEDYKAGVILTLRGVDIITGPSWLPKTIYELGHISQGEVEVLSRDENAETITLLVSRLTDGEKFKLTATKPGPWDQRPFAKEATP